MAVQDWRGTASEGRNRSRYKIPRPNNLEGGFERTADGVGGFKGTSSVPLDVPNLRMFAEGMTYAAALAVTVRDTFNRVGCLFWALNFPVSMFKRSSGALLAAFRSTRAGPWGLRSPRSQ